MINNKTPYEVLNSVIGYTSFGLGQEEIIDKLLNNTSLLAVMPTGAGKSICYQIPSLLKDGFTVVISPLISLMEDQVAGLNGYGIEAACIHSNNNRDENISQWLKIKEYGAKLLYMSPERLMTDRMLQALENLPVNTFVNLGTHDCDCNCTPNTNILELENTFSIYPNPTTKSKINILRSNKIQ